MKPRTSFGFVAVFMAFVLIATIKIQHEHLKIDMRASQLKGEPQERWRRGLEGLPRGIVSETSDLELKSLWQKSRSTKEDSSSCNALLAMAVGIAQKKNVDRIVSKFVAENCSAILFHYDGNVDGWRDLSWNNKAIHIVAQNQTKWWFAKRFLHPDVVSTYDHIFLWDEDLGVDNFNPKRYLEIMLSEGLEISQPALDPNKSTDIHHRITVRNSRRIVHRRVYSKHGSLNCSSQSTGPPCTGWVEGMAPVFSQAAWRCVWHLIQNDLIHGWGLDMKLGYCAQGDRTKKVGVIDKEFVVHQGIPPWEALFQIRCLFCLYVLFSLGACQISNFICKADQISYIPSLLLLQPPQRSLDMRTMVRRQSTAELTKFKERWNKAVEEDKRWRDPFKDASRRKRDDTSRRKRDDTSRRRKR